MLSLEGKVVLITGGTGGLGQAASRAAAEAGAHVVVAYRSRSAADALQRALARRGLVCELEQADVTDPDAVGRMVAGVVERHGRVDGLACLAGGYAGGVAVAELSDEAWDAQMRLNLYTAVVCCRAVVPHMLARRAGRVVTVASRAALRPGGGAAAYNASKAAVIAFTQTLSEEVKHHGITANCIVPSVIDTPANRAAMPSADHGRWVRPEDIADVVVFLLSDASRAVTGAVIPVYGQS